VRHDETDWNRERRYQRPLHALGATLLALTVSAAVAVPGGAATLVIVLPVTHGAARGVCRSLGGLSGDSYGALVELAQTVTLLWLSGLAHHGVRLFGG
jgi:adenosylcobinamide-GDP ribazoletransferase